MCDVIGTDSKTRAVEPEPQASPPSRDGAMVNMPIHMFDTRTRGRTCDFVATVENVPVSQFPKESPDGLLDVRKT